MIYRTVPLDQIREPDWCWHHDDEIVAHKIDGSLAQHGQLRAIVVRQVGDVLEIVEGRSLLRAMRRANITSATVADLGPIEKDTATLVAMSLELHQDTDYVKLGQEITKLVASQGNGFSAIVPFTGVDIEYYRVLSADFDWSQFHEEDRQEGLFGEEMAEVVAAESLSYVEDIPSLMGAPEPDQGVAPPQAPKPPRTSPSKLVPLPSGPSALAFATAGRLTLVSTTTPDPARLLMADLERRGHRLLTRDGKFFVSDASLLTPQDREAIAEHRTFLVSQAQPWVEEKPKSLAVFLGTASPVIEFVPDEPPSLDGISEVVLNFATTGLDWVHGHKPAGVTVSTLDGQLTRFLPFGFAGGNLDESAVKQWAERELRGKKIYGANLRFDCHMSRVWGVDLEAQGNTFSDIQHTAAILDDSRRKFALDVLATDYLSGPVEARVDETRHADHHASEVAVRELYTARLVGRLQAVLYPQLDEQDLRRVQDLEDAVIPCVVEMEKNGAPIDVPLLKQWCAETKRLQEEALWEVARHVGFAVNPNSPGDWIKLFEYCHLPVIDFTDGGKPSFTDAVLKDIDNQYVQMTRKAGKLASLRAKFLDAYDAVIGSDGLLRYNLHQLRGDEYGTVRGRFSASDKNIQQVMNHSTHLGSFGSEDFFVRRLFIAGNGLSLSADARQIEYRIFASHSASPKILASYAENPDLDYHDLVMELVKPFKADIQRDRAKALNFMKIYGGGKEKTAAMLGLPRAESDQFTAIYDRMFPEVPILLRQATHIAETRGYVRTILGRRARFPDKKFAHKALNAVIQGSAADIMKQKLVELHASRKTTGFTMRYTVHDEVCGDVPDQKSARLVAEALNRQSFAMLKVPILWSVSTGANWAACK